MRPIIVWFRRDLRVEDHAALYHASLSGAPIVPLFIFDTEIIKALPSDGAAFDFQAQCLRDLKRSLEKLGGKLILRKGRAKAVHSSLIGELKPSALYFNRDYEPSARRRDAEIALLYESNEIEVRTFKDHVLQEGDEVLTNAGTPYSVFTPFANTWKKLPPPLPYERPKRITGPRIFSEPILDARGLKKRVKIPHPAFEGGERVARNAWKRFLEKGIFEYGTDRDIPCLEGTSRMSAYLRFGCISARTLHYDCQSGLDSAPARARKSIQKYIDELIWREFYQAVLFHFPRLVDSSYRKEFDQMPWSRSRATLKAWQEGKTGYPLVDAGMRQLNQTGWMHNRVRMVVASFLTKDLRHDWRKGERYFEEKLLDIDTASNNGGWQWSASTGVDPKPLRIFNPRRQSERYDPEGVYIRKYVPELRNVPQKFIHAPHEMPQALQRDIGCIIGKSYPKPVVDHSVAAAEYKRFFASVKGQK